MRRRSIGAALLLAAAQNTWSADLQQQLGSCRGIADGTQRLACYDALSAPAAVPESASTAPPPAPAPATAAPAAAPPLDVTATPAAPAMPAAAAEQNFGAESVRKPPAKGEPQVERIESRLLAAVEETRRGQRYKLENGQTWLDIDDRNRYVDADAGSAVAIERNFMGNYWMRFGDHGASVRVRRVE